MHIILRLFYIVITYVLIPVVLLHLVWKGFGNRDYWKRIGERFEAGRILVFRPGDALALNATAAGARLLPAVLAGFIGLALITISGHVQATALHDAAHELGARRAAAVDQHADRVAPTRPVGPCPCAGVLTRRRRAEPGRDRQRRRPA